MESPARFQHVLTPLLVQDDRQKWRVDFDSAAVLDEAHLSEFVRALPFGGNFKASAKFDFSVVMGRRGRIGAMACGKS
jgi:hypothetical protein